MGEHGLPSWVRGDVVSTTTNERTNPMSEVAGSRTSVGAFHDESSRVGDPGVPAVNATDADHAVVEFAGARIEPAVVRGTEGVSGLEISRLLATLGVVALDPGYANTGSTTSAVTYIDGEAGILRYRGYPIERLAESSSFLETSYLLIRGELPSSAELDAFTRRISRHTDAARGPEALLRRLPPERRPGVGAVQRGERVVNLPRGRPRPVRPRAGGAVHGTAAGQGADDRRLRLPEIRRASRCCTRTTPSGMSRTSCGCPSGSRRNRTSRTPRWSGPWIGC